jgi:hypothetical protein
MRQADAQVLPPASAFTGVYAELHELADDYLDRPITATIDTFEDGTFRVQVYHHISPDGREALYYHSEEGEILYGVEASDELKTVERVKTPEAADASGQFASDS